MFGYDKRWIEAHHKAILYPIVRVRTAKAGGSGTVIYSKPHPEQPDEHETYILTCHHVVSEAIKIEKDWFDPVLKKKRAREVTAPVQVEVFRYARLSYVDSGATHRASIVAYDADHDLALLKLDSPFPVEHVAEFYPKGKEQEIKLFEPVWAAGCSLGHDPLCNQGFITYKPELIDGKEYWMSNAAVIFGNSGGAIFLERTLQLIGVPARVSVMQMGFGLDVNTWMNWFVPINRIYNFLDDNMLYFLYDNNYTSVECFKMLEEKREQARLGGGDK